MLYFGPTVRGNYHVGLDSRHHALLASEHLQNWDNGKENGNYYIIIKYTLGLYWDNGKENGNYYNGLYRVYIGVILG